MAKLIESLKKIGVVRRGKVKLKHAGVSKFYIDIKKAYGYPHILDELCRRLQELMPKKVNCIATGGYGGLPLATVLALKYKLKLVLVREKAKTHGRNVWIDGYVPGKEDSVLIVDDVLTTGKSIRHIIRVLRPTGAKISGCAVVVKRGKGKIGISCRHLLTLEELL